MNNEFQILSHQPLSTNTIVAHHQLSTTKKISLDDAAYSLMTDFQYVRPFLISASATIDEINQKMIACGVRLLFVAESGKKLQGLVTYNDLFGEKPVRYVQEHGGLRDEITTQDIMTPLNQLEALKLTDILKASVGDILKTIKYSGRQHLLVVDNQIQTAHMIIGLFSSTEMAKQLGIKIEISPRANTFADLERALA